MAYFEIALINTRFVWANYFKAGSMQVQKRVA